MALSGADRGTGNHNTSALVFGIRATTNFSSKTSWAVLCVACDNSDSGGAAHSTFAVTDSLGNTWTRRVSALSDPGAASAGVEGAVFTCPQNYSIITTATTITVTFDANCTAKCWTLAEVTPTTGYKVVFATSGNGTSATTTTPSITTTSITSGYIVFGALFNEYGTAQTVTQDGDTTNGNWSTQQTNEIGSTTSGITVASQYKVVTASATQTYNPTLGTSSDLVLGWLALRESVLALYDLIGVGGIPVKR